MMKFLIDECLSPDLAEVARGRGFVESSHVVWMGKAGSTKIGSRNIRNPCLAQAGNRTAGTFCDEGRRLQINSCSPEEVEFWFREASWATPG